MGYLDFKLESKHIDNASSALLVATTSFVMQPSNFKRSVLYIEALLIDHYTQRKELIVDVLNFSRSL